MKKSSCYTYFRITGDFDPDEATKVLGLKPFRSWKKGDLRRENSYYEFSNWSFGLCEDDTLYVSEQLRKTIEPLLSKIDILNKFKQEHDVQTDLEIVPELYRKNKGPQPCISPTLDIIDFCYATKTEMDIDLYIY